MAYWEKENLILDVLFQKIKLLISYIPRSGFQDIFMPWVWDKNLFFHGMIYNVYNWRSLLLYHVNVESYEMHFEDIVATLIYSTIKKMDY